MNRQVNKRKINKAQTSEPTLPVPRLPDEARGTTEAQPPSGHIVLASADSEGYRSLRRRPVSRAERFNLGRNLRHQVPRSAMGDWKAPPNRPDPVEQIRHSHEGRLDWLIPIRVGRMVASPYGFLRGTAVVMAEDVAHLPATGITPVIGGDAHLGNFGFYASPERRPGHRLKRLRRGASRRLGVGSAPLGGEHLGGRSRERVPARRSAADRWRPVLPPTARKYVSSPTSRCCRAPTSDSTSTECARRPPRRSLRGEIERAARRARSRTSDRALPRFTTERDGRRHIVDEPPLITRVLAD